MLRGELGDPSADRRGLVILHCRRRRARIVGGETYAAGEHCENEREQYVTPHRLQSPWRTEHRVGAGRGANP